MPDPHHSPDSNGSASTALSESLPRLTFETTVLCACAAVCYGGWLTLFSTRVFTTEHYQFAPIYIVAVMVLVYSRRTKSRPAPKRRTRWQPLTVALSLIFLTVATVLNSPLLGSISLLLLVDGLMPAYRMSRQALRLLWVLVPLPLGYDRTVILDLQLFSSKQASAVLDALRIPHLMSGTVLELPGKRLLVEEACSGLGSVYLLLAVALLVAVATRQRLLVAIPLALMSFVWAVAGNIFRIAAIAVAHSKYQLDLSSGWPHEVLGITTMLLSVAGIGLTAWFLKSLFSPVSQIFDTESKVSRYLTPEILWNLSTTTDNSYRSPQSQPGLHIKSHPRILTVISFCLLIAAMFYWTPLDARELLDPLISRATSTSDHSLHASTRLDSIDAATLFPKFDVTEVSSTSDDARSKSWDVNSEDRSYILNIVPHSVSRPAVLQPLVLQKWSVLSVTEFPIGGVPTGQPVTEDGLGVAVLAKDDKFTLISWCCFLPSSSILSVPDERQLVDPAASGRLTSDGADESEVVELSLLWETDARPSTFDIESQADTFRQTFNRLRRQWTTNRKLESRETE